MLFTSTGDLERGKKLEFGLNSELFWHDYEVLYPRQQLPNTLLLPASNGGKKKPFSIVINSDLI